MTLTVHGILLHKQSENMCAISLIFLSYGRFTGIENTLFKTISHLQTSKINTEKNLQGDV